MHLIAAPSLSSSSPIDAGYAATDSIPATRGLNAADIESFIPIPASKLGAQAPVEWLWEGYIARGVITLLTGLWKAGKTTLIGHVLRGMGEGGQIGGRITSGRVLVVSEESGAAWVRRRERLKLADHADFLIRPFKGKPSQHRWELFITHVASLVKENHYALVILDTFAAVSPLIDENSAGTMMMALLPLHQITEAGAGLLLIHHPRKGDADEGQAARGSGALPGFVDIILELRRFNASRAENRRRKLTAYSRFDETPLEVVIELTDEGYRSCGTVPEFKRSERLDTIEAILNKSPAPLTCHELRASWPNVLAPGLRTLRDDLAHAEASQRFVKTGSGKKGDPFKFASAPQGKGSDAASALR